LPEGGAEIRQYTKLFWINSGLYNGITARKSLLRIGRGWSRAVEAGEGRRGVLFLLPGIGARPGEVPRRSCSMRRSTRGHQQVAGLAASILRESANNLYVGADGDLEAFDELRSTHCWSRRPSLVKRYRVGGRMITRSVASSAISRTPWP
jgi:dipeptidyl-peptidase-3